MAQAERNRQQEAAQAAEQARIAEQARLAAEQAAREQAMRAERECIAAEQARQQAVAAEARAQQEVQARQVAEAKTQHVEMTIATRGAYREMGMALAKGGKTKLVTKIDIPSIDNVPPAQPPSLLERAASSARALGSSLSSLLSPGQQTAKPPAHSGNPSAGKNSLPAP